MGAIFTAFMALTEELGLLLSINCREGEFLRDLTSVFVKYRTVCQQMLGREKILRLLISSIKYGYSVNN